MWLLNKGKKINVTNGSTFNKLENVTRKAN